jgi:DNA-directed RNA polymerase subunit RPC12/RpoP
LCTRCALVQAVRRRPPRASRESRSPKPAHLHELGFCGSRTRGRFRPPCLNGYVSWQHRLPQGISDFRETPEGFQATISIPADEEGLFGRQCPDCERFFKMRVDQWEALSDDAIVTCPYCGHRPVDLNDFMTQQQSQRVQSAADALAEQYVHQAIQDAFSGLGTRRLRPASQGSRSRLVRTRRRLFDR